MFVLELDETESVVDRIVTRSKLSSRATGLCYHQIHSCESRFDSNREAGLNGLIHKWQAGFGRSLLGQSGAENMRAHQLVVRESMLGRERDGSFRPIDSRGPFLTKAIQHGAEIGRIDQVVCGREFFGGP